MKATATLVLALLPLSAPAAAQQRQRLSMDPGWRFIQRGPGGADRRRACNGRGLAIKRGDSLPTLPASR